MKLGVVWQAWFFGKYSCSHLNMLLQISLLGKGVTAEVASVRPDLLVNVLYVLVEDALLGVLAVAVGTGERLGSLVDVFHVLEDCRLPATLVGADAALERSAALLMDDDLVACNSIMMLSGRLIDIPTFFR